MSILFANRKVFVPLWNSAVWSIEIWVYWLILDFLIKYNILSLINDEYSYTLQSKHFKAYKWIFLGRKKNFLIVAKELLSNHEQTANNLSKD